MVLIEYGILKHLSFGESYGHEIVRDLRAMDEFTILEGDIFDIMTRLMRNEQTRCRDADPQKGPPDWRYSLTAQGRQRLKKMEKCWTNVSKAVKHLGDYRAPDSSLD
jgi:DNA-binding PadR family transcriptional regulator